MQLWAKKSLTHLLNFNTAWLKNFYLHVLGNCDIYFLPLLLHYDLEISVISEIRECCSQISMHTEKHQKILLKWLIFLLKIRQILIPDTKRAILSRNGTACSLHFLIW